MSSDTPRTDVDRLMKRCQIGVGGRNALNDAHEIMADCYGTLGRLQSELAAMTKRATDAENDSNIWAERFRKAAIERNEALAELARLTTLRPASEHDGQEMVLWYDHDGHDYKWVPVCVDTTNLMSCLRWTPLPPVKEPT